jgi:hypothetical protein
MIGMDYYISRKRILRFLTLTGVDNEEGYRRNFNKLRRVLRRRFGQFEYFAVRTNEGTKGVLHLLYVGLSFKYAELRNYWQKLTGHWTVSISSVKNFRGIGFEMTRQMQTVRYSQSRKWFKNVGQTTLIPM